VKKNSQRTYLAIAVVVIGLVLMGIALFSLFKPTSNPPVTVVNPLEALIPYPEVDRISVDEAEKAFNKKRAIFLDVRGDSSFEDRHIPGSLSIPLEMLDDRISQLSADDWIITYCT
jgi:hypothetical protein